jgi:FG-GAP repeat
MSRRWRPRFSAVLIGLGVGLGVAVPSIASADLPAGYDVQKIDSPLPTAGGDFGIAMAKVGDLNGDGKQDIVIGTDEHGGSAGTIFELSGADGSLIRSISSPDAAGDTGTLPSFGSYVGGLPDIGGCTSNPGAGSNCPAANVTTTPDGTPEVLVSALGQDVGGVQDIGRGYVLDGATGAVLKRLDMPAADITFLTTTAPSAQRKPALGRTILNPSSPYGVGNAAPPAAVQIGDMDGGGKPDVIVDASDFWENGSSANPQSECATTSATSCLQAGRAYVYYGESWIGSDPSVPDNTPDMTIKNPAAQGDDLTQPVNNNRENLGYSIEPVGDLGQCTTSPGVGAACPDASGNATPDGFPDVAISSHRTDDFGMMDAGVVPLFDGKKGTVLITYHHPEPQPASLFGFSNYNQPAIGDVGQSTAPDVYQAAMRQNNPYTGGGKGYVMNGAFRQSGSPNSISFSTMVDPTPHPSEDFGTSSAGIGDVFGDSHNEILIGAYGPHNPGTNPDVINDVHIFDPIHEVSLLDIPAPDQQPGLGFGTSLAPLGDLNGDGFLDFAVGAGLFDGPSPDASCPAPPALCSNIGRVYIFRSNNTSPSPPSTTPVQAGRAITLGASKRTVRKGKKFALRGTLSSPVNPGSCAAGQSVVLERAKRGGSGFTPFAGVTTDGSGAFSLKVKAKRTFRYMAHVDATSTCGAADSSSLKVKVKK